MTNRGDDRRRSAPKGGAGGRVIVPGPVSGTFRRTQGSPPAAPPLAVVLAQRAARDREAYRELHHLTLPHPGGHPGAGEGRVPPRLRIDHLVVSRYGLFVVETKSLAGWIFGAPEAPCWTQVVLGQRHAFRNPLWENQMRIAALEAFLKLPRSHIQSVVVFTGASAELKGCFPENVVRGGPFAFIRRHTTPLFDDRQLAEILAALAEGTPLAPAAGVRPRIPARSLLSAAPTDAGPGLCPRCGSPLVRRTLPREIAGEAPHDGHPSATLDFYGCKRFPACRHVEDC